MRRVLITGEGGFVGRHIESMRDELYRHFEWDLVVPKSEYDLLEPASLAELLINDLPDAVIHLAGISYVPDSIRHPCRTFEVNVLGTLNLLQALKAAGFVGRFLYISSGDVYGRLSDGELPVQEGRLPRPLNPYSASKVSAEALCYQWSQAGSFERVIIARPFNHIGAGQREDFVVSSMAKQIIQIKRGLQAPVLSTGDIDVTRDFLDVKDVIYGYMALIEAGENGETYNVCSGVEQSIRDLIRLMLDEAGVEAKIQTDEKRCRVIDQRRSQGSNKKLVTTTGWGQTISLRSSLHEALNYWESRI